jgi:hypothetical protein
LRRQQHIKMNALLQEHYNGKCYILP